MNEMEHHRRAMGMALLRKWLNGDITGDQELELFDLAAKDDMLREALEGYIGQRAIGASELPGNAVEALYPGLPGREPVERAARRYGLRYAAVLALIFAMAAWLLTRSVSGEQAEVFTADIPELPQQYESVEKGQEMQIAQRDRIIPAEQRTDEHVISHVAERTESPRSNDVVMTDAVPQNDLAGLADRTEPVSVQKSDRPEPIDLTDALNGDMSFRLPAETVSSGIPDEPVSTAREQDDDVAVVMQFFDHEADEELKREVELESIKQGNEPIKGYEIDVVSGISPDDLTAMDGGMRELRDSTGLDRVGLRGQVNLSDASSAGRGAAPANVIANNVVITEYTIRKKDITDPPIEDFNSLVRERYKKRAKPEVGFYKYKKYLRTATGCLTETYTNMDYLEDVVVKFRVFRDGGIEFLELFGTPGGRCTEPISAAITSGPSWQLDDRYESIDVEIPFKALYPYWY